MRNFSKLNSFVAGESAASIVKSLANTEDIVSSIEERSGSSVSASALANSIIAPDTDLFKIKPNALYPNEQLHAIQYDDVLWARISGRNIHTGKIILTDFRLLFVDDSHKEIFAVPYGTICRIEKVGNQSTTAEGSYGIEVYCKDFRKVFFAARKVGKTRRHIYDDLCYRTFWQRSPWPRYAKHYKESLTSTAVGQDLFVRGWNIYRRLAEFERMELPHGENGPWYVDSFINEKYEFCETYPCILVYPQKFKPDNGYEESDCPLYRVRDFRSKGRIPVLSWYNKRNHATICRCSQPLTGISNRPCEADRDLFKAIADCNPSQGPALMIMDARPKMNARANMTMGGGYETYSEHRLEFLNIPNIHVMRESLKKLEDLIYPTVKDNKSFLVDLENSGWLWYVKHVLEGACRVAASISVMNMSVVIHCSDGWDRTAQLTSLAMIMLDGYYRTLEGFMVLVEKEWLSFGHKFASRIGHGDEKYNDSERSPIFLQFIDAVYQLLQQVNFAFEFNEWFLITILDHLYSCQFGTFLCNCEKERLELGVFENTVSLWSYILENKESFINPFYQPAMKEQVVIPSCSIRLMKLWSNYYCRNCINFHSTMEDQVTRWKQLQNSKQHIEKEIDDLKSRIKSMATKCNEPKQTTESCPESITCLNVGDEIFSKAMDHLNKALVDAEFEVLPNIPEDISAEQNCGEDWSRTLHDTESETESTQSNEDDLNKAYQVSSF